MGSQFKMTTGTQESELVLALNIERPTGLTGLLECH